MAGSLSASRATCSTLSRKFLSTTTMQTAREKSLGTFKSMSKGGLSNPLFEQDKLDELVVETFRPAILTEQAIGQPMKFSMKENNPFRIFGLPKNILLEFRLLSKPCSIIRDITLQTIDILNTASVKPSQNTRVVLTGDPGSGKSFTLLQAVQYALERRWIVIYIPRSIPLVNSSTPYLYDPRTRTYLQPHASYQLLQRLLTVNHTTLSSLYTTKDLVIDRKANFAAGASLEKLVDIGVKDISIAPIVLEKLLEELSEQTHHPVLLAVDGFQSLYCQTQYRDPHYQPIKPWHLSLPRLLLEYASGRKSFERGAILGAISNSNHRFPTPLELREQLSLAHPLPLSPYFKRSSILQGYAKGLEKLEVPGKLTVEEAAGMFDVWAKDRALGDERTNDEMFLAKYTEASGNPRDFVWKGLLGTLET